MLLISTALYVLTSIMYFFNFIFKKYFKNKTYYFLNATYTLYFILAALIISYFIYILDDSYNITFENWNDNKYYDISFLKKILNIINIALICFTTTFLISVFLLIIDFFSYDKQLKFYKHLLFIKDKKAIKFNEKELSSIRKSYSYYLKHKFITYEKFNLLKKVEWKKEFDNLVVLQNTELEEIISNYTYNEHFIELKKYTNTNEFMIYIGDERHEIILYPFYIKDITQSFYYINLSIYNRLIFKAAYYKLASNISITIDYNLRVVNNKYKINILEDFEMCKILLKLTSDYLNDFLCMLYNKLRKFEINKFKEFYNISSLIDYGESYYNEFLNAIFEKLYNKYINYIKGNSIGNINDKSLLEAFDYFGLTLDTSYDQFKKNYRLFAKKNHPDINKEKKLKIDMTVVNKYKNIVEEFYKLKH
ncbi:hypothetical protein STURON_00742 [Spiroplasma turonicum]|uniref:J domain-containing protein n=2 Tax=Spiroplasma turonicum TaxID=216946 RepID=A0A0K1P6R9_9MOLU|nr:hypothetical protein STURON_00742 [Spiroplasma turonicum]